MVPLAVRECFSRFLIRRGNLASFLAVTREASGRSKTAALIRPNVTAGPRAGHSRTIGCHPSFETIFVEKMSAERDQTVDGWCCHVNGDLAFRTAGRNVLDFCAHGKLLFD